MTKKRRITGAAVIFVAIVLLLSTVFSVWTDASAGGDGVTIRDITKEFSTNKEAYYNGTTILRLPEGIADDQEISVIIRTDNYTLMDAHGEKGKGMTFAEFSLSDTAKSWRSSIAKEKASILAVLDEKGIEYETGRNYDTVLSGFEIVIRAGDFEEVSRSLGDGAEAVVSEVYNEAKTQLVENTVDVYETGIFDSSDFRYDGTGVVVAVLDTGLDYTHTAFDPSRFTVPDAKLGLTLTDVAAVLAKTEAYGIVSGLTAEDVYVNRKVPFGFDYADNDSDVFPIRSHHGTHVSGIIAGKDSTITGVAPNAQLVEMKIFSDSEDTARASWILAALEDCVVLGVDVINLSIGTSCGFSRESDKEIMSGVYDRIREAGISLIVAASNSFSSTYGSEKNGNLGLTTNPDNGTVGSPSTYAGALCVASINGAKTPYLFFNDTIIYFLESTDRASEEKDFVDEILGEGQDSATIEYVTIPGIGRSADYTGIDVTDKIVLVRRGDTTFEEKAMVAQAKGAAGIIIYNNVAGDIKMTVGDATLAVCSIGQDDGEMLAEQKSGTLTIARSQTSGPFMSDFSSWGPTPDLEIKPEITAHGGSILSAVPGQDYDRISGTSMAAPNVSGVTALMQQYIKEELPEFASSKREITDTLYRLLMSTADIVYNKNGLPYAVRKQGAGLANLNSATTTKAMLLTYDRVSGELMDKSKIELGDDPKKVGVYTLYFEIYNFGDTAASYDFSTIVLTEGVSETLTNDGETTVTEEAYQLSPDVKLTKVESATQSGENITVAAGATAKITVTVTLSDADRKYLDDSFANGMYVEGFVRLTAAGDTEVSLGLPFLGFYGDWSVAPMMDIDYYETNRDELDDSIDLLDKTLPDAYATRPIGGVENDYVSYLGSYYFEQDPGATLIAADRKYISLSNQTTALNSLRYVWTGMLRSAQRIEITITEDSTGEVIFSRTETDIRKSYGDGGSIYPANIEVEFSAIDHNLTNNSKYTVKLEGFLDYERDGAETNLNNTFEFPIVADFEAPSLTGVEFYTEYDRSEKETRLYAKLAVYDNHYSMAANVGYVGLVDEGEGNVSYMLNLFDRYPTALYSDFNSTTYLTVELTDYMETIVNESRSGAGGGSCFTVSLYDYALNEATYEIELPASFTDLCFAEETLTLSPNQVEPLDVMVYPETEWSETLTFISTNQNVARIVGNKVVAVAPGQSVIIARDLATGKQATMALTVLGKDDEGYKKYDKPVVDTFDIVGYRTEKAFYYVASVDREIGATGDERKFSYATALSMFPSEAVTLRYQLTPYFPDDVTLSFTSSNPNIAKVDQNGKIVAVNEGFATITIQVYMDGKTTFYSKSVSVEVKDPYITSGPNLTSYFGNGGTVEIPKRLALTTIGQYAFSNYDYIPKEPWEEVSDEYPGVTKITYIGENTIETVIIPEGVESIGDYAFAGLTALKRVVLPSTLKNIGVGAFYGCTSLEVVEGLGDVQFISKDAFGNCNLKGTLNLEKTVAVADYAFANNKSLEGVVFGTSTQSMAIGAFEGCSKLATVTINASSVKLGSRIFRGCSSLTEVTVNAAVIPSYAFDTCTELTRVNFGKDVAVLGELAFRDSKVAKFTVAEGNTALKASADGSYVTNAAGNTLLLVAQTVSGEFVLDDSAITVIGIGAFAGNDKLTSVKMPHVTYLGDYAFADCKKLASFTLGTLTYLGDYAFYGTAITEAPSFEGLDEIGEYAFQYASKLASVTLPDGIRVGKGAFQECKALATVTVGNNVVLGEDAFRLDYANENFKTESYKKGDLRYYYAVMVSPLHSLTIGNNVTIGSGAFYGASELSTVTLGTGAVIGDWAFYNSASLTSIDLSHAVSIGKGAFSGAVFYEYLDDSYTTPAADSEGNYIYRYYAPRLTSVNLANADSVGEEAFMYCPELASVTLGDSVKKIGVNAFNACYKLSSVNLGSVTEIGDYAFAECALTAVDLSSALKVGNYAFFQNLALASAKLATGAEIGEGAFSYCEALNAVENMAGVASLDSYAFAYTAVTEADLGGASSIGSYAFLKRTATPFAVTLGDGIVYLGDNPFAMCIVAPFTSTVKESFNGKDYDKVIDTFDLSETVRVINGSLYRVVPNGLEMILYANKDGVCHVADGTVRIAAMAFAGTDVREVILPGTVAAIGHKAFYACNRLVMVTFQSYDAPMLEEEYDYQHFLSVESLPATGAYGVTTPEGEKLVDGIGIVPFFMWNLTSSPTNYYYGATFVDYVGHVKTPLVMVSPSNGKNYDSFIFSKYFSTNINGTAAPDDVTLNAIDAINRLPETVQLTDKALVVAARAAYDRIASLEQRALVKDYSKLTQAEKRIADLEYLQNQGGETPPEEEPAPTPSTDSNVQRVIMVVLCIFLAIAILETLLLLWQFKKRRQ